MRNVTAPKVFSPAAEFWSVLIVPWILDIAGGRGLLTSLFGALLWGMAVVLAAVRPQTHDARFRTRQGQALLFISAAWLGYWVFSFFEAPRHLSLAPESIRLLTWLHAGLLTAGFGMVCVLGSASCLWLLQEAVLRKSSWERRQWKGRLPSLESVASICRRAVQLAFASWGLGLLLAVFTAVMRWPAAHEGEVAWGLDPRVVVTALLWLALACGFQISVRAKDGGRWLYRSYLGLSFFFVVCFAWFMLTQRGSLVHEKLSWFI